MDDNLHEQDHREEALAQREAELAQRERQLKALEELRRLKLPEALQEQLDLGSDEALHRSLGMAQQLFALARLHSAEQQAPKRFQPPPEAVQHMNYAQRAALYERDREGYNQAFGGENRWMSR